MWEVCFARVFWRFLVSSVSCIVLSQKVLTKYDTVSVGTADIHADSVRFLNCHGMVSLCIRPRKVHLDDNRSEIGLAATYTPVDCSAVDSQSSRGHEDAKKCRQPLIPNPRIPLSIARDNGNSRH